MINKESWILTPYHVLSYHLKCYLSWHLHQWVINIYTLCCILFLKFKILSIRGWTAATKRESRFSFLTEDTLTCWEKVQLREVTAGLHLDVLALVLFLLWEVKISATCNGFITVKENSVEMDVFVCELSLKCCQIATQQLLV